MLKSLIFINAFKHVVTCNITNSELNTHQYDRLIKLNYIKIVGR